MCIIGKRLKKKMEKFKTYHSKIFITLSIAFLTRLIIPCLSKIGGTDGKLFVPNNAAENPIKPELSVIVCLHKVNSSILRRRIIS